MRVEALCYIGEKASGDHPAFTMAEKGQVLDVVEVFKDRQWDYVLQDIDKKWPTFYAIKSEVEEVKNANN